MELRNARAEDRSAVLALYRSAIGTEGCVWDDEYPSELCLDLDIAAGTLFVYVHDGTVIGAVSVVRENELDELAGWSETDGEIREIARVVISRERRGKGLAAAMLGELFAKLREKGTGAVRILAARENPAAIATYRRLGFTFTGECTMFGHEYYSAELIL